MQQVLHTARVRRSISCYALPSYGTSSIDNDVIHQQSSTSNEENSDNSQHKKQQQVTSANTLDVRSSNNRAMSRAEDAESLENDNEDRISESRHQMYEELKARKESLESSLRSKLAELKAICIQEAVCITLFALTTFFSCPFITVLLIYPVVFIFLLLLTDQLPFSHANYVIDLVTTSLDFFLFVSSHSSLFKCVYVLLF